jgi:hypothetical protein
MERCGVESAAGVVLGPCGGGPNGQGRCCQPLAFGWSGGAAGDGVRLGQPVAGRDVGRSVAADERVSPAQIVRKSTMGQWWAAPCWRFRCFAVLSNKFYQSCCSSGGHQLNGTVWLYWETSITHRNIFSSRRPRQLWKEEARSAVSDDEPLRVVSCDTMLLGNVLCQAPGEISSFIMFLLAWSFFFLDVGVN